jgi:hypothetical protein
VILPDHDDVGRKHAEDVATSLDGIAASVKVLALADLPEKGDVSDRLDAGGTREQLEALAAEAPVWARIDVSRDDFVTAADPIAEPDERVSWLVDGMLPAGGLSLNVAKPKVGKSTLARNLSASVASGTSFLGRTTIRGVVLYCAFEEKRDDVKRHLRDLGAAEQLFVYVGAVPADPVAWLRRAILNHHAALVVIDTLGRFMCARDLNSDAETTKLSGPLLALAHETGAHIHCLHPAGKGERQGTDAALGSTALTGFVDTVLVLKRRDRTRTLETIQRTGTDLPETVVALDKDTGRVTLGGLLGDDRIADVIPAVLRVIARDVRTEAAIREAVGGDRVITGEGDPPGLQGQAALP